MDLTEQSLQTIQDLVQELNFPQFCVEQAHLQFQDYSKKTKNTIQHEKIKIIAICALLVIVKTHKIKGIHLGGTSTNLPYLLKDCPDRLDEVILVLKEFVTFGQVIEEVRTELKAIIEQFSFMLTISAKFEKVFRIIVTQESTLQQRNYNRQLKLISWLLLLLTRIDASEKQAIIETTLQVVAVFQFLIEGVQRFTSSQFIDENKGNEKAALLKLFSIQDVDSYEAVYQRFLSSILQLREKGLISIEGDMCSLMSPYLIEANAQNLSSFYQNEIKKDLNEQYFIQEKKPQSANPINFTPFSRQGGYNKQAAPFPQEKYGASTSSLQNMNTYQSRQLSGNNKLTSQRFLNYDNDNDSNSLEKKPITEFKTPSQIIASPNTSKQQTMSRVSATPITNAMEMYNWLHSRKNILSCSSGTIAMELNRKIPNLDYWLNEELEKVEEFEKNEEAALRGHKKEEYQQEPRAQEQRKQQIISLFYRILNEYIVEEKSSSEESRKGILVCACESVYFILNVRSISFEKLVCFLKLTWYELRKLMDFYMRLDQSMPLSLKAHILDLEARVISYYAWREESQLLSFVKAYIADSESARKLLDDRQEGYAIEKFFRRVLHQCAYSINQICSSLKLSDIISEGVWRLMKHILGNQSELLVGRHIDQLILCSIYVMCKIFKTDTQFKQILNKYEELNQHNKSMMRELIYDLPISNEKRDTIVEFYNVTYLPQLKKAALTISKELNQEGVSSLSSPRKQEAQSKNPAISGQVLASPLKYILPNDVRKSIQKLPSHMTPQTQMLYAYTESPLLKDGMINQQSFRNFNSKKMINFDAEPAFKSGGTQSPTQQQEKIVFSKYLKPNMDSIQESQQETFSNSNPNKFKKGLSDNQQQMKRNLFKESAHTEVDISDISNINNPNSSNISIQSTPRIVAQNNHNTQMKSNTETFQINHNNNNNSNTVSNNNSNNSNSQFNGSFLKNFTKQSQYQYNPLVSPLKQPMAQNSQQFRVMTPINQQQQQLSQYQQQQQQQQQFVQMQSPLQQIPQQKINSWQNQAQIGLQKQGKPAPSNFFDNFKKKQ